MKSQWLYALLGFLFFLYTNRYLYGINGRFLHKKRNVLGEFLCDKKSVLEKIAKSLHAFKMKSRAKKSENGGNRCKIYRFCIYKT